MDQQKRFTNEVLLKLIGGVVTCLTAGVLYMIGGQIELQRRLSIMESNRFTSTEAMRLVERIQALEVTVARIPTEVPPRWFIDQVNRIEKRVDAMAEKVDSIYARSPNKEKQP